MSSRASLSRDVDGQPEEGVLVRKLGAEGDTQWNELPDRLTYDDGRMEGTGHTAGMPNRDNNSEGRAWEQRTGREDFVTGSWQLGVGSTRTWWSRRWRRISSSGSC